LNQALDGEEVVIAKAGKPLVRLVPMVSSSDPRHGGFLRGSAVIDADLKADFREDIAAMFG
jgi:antitoxin (DNA-binding transcriptional repressor) of toxin-antitoxin stability system